MHNLNAFVRDFYFFKRSQYPQLNLGKLKLKLFSCQFLLLFSSHEPNGSIRHSSTTSIYFAVCRIGKSMPSLKINRILTKIVWYFQTGFEQPINCKVILSRNSTSSLLARRTHEVAIFSEESFRSKLWTLQWTYGVCRNCIICQRDLVWFQGKLSA